MTKYEPDVLAGDRWHHYMCAKPATGRCTCDGGQACDQDEDCPWAMTGAPHYRRTCQRNK